MDGIKVLLVEDHTMVRLGLSLVFENSKDINLIGEAENGKKGVELALNLNPDVILMDIGLPEMDGIQATSLIKKSNPNIKVLIFTSRESEDDVFDSLSAGADGYIMKGANEEQMISAIKAVAEGTAWLDPAIARLVLSSVKRQTSTSVDNNISSVNKNAKNVYGLTDREIEVLALIVEGLNNSQIAKRLVITLSTAKAHVHSILQKLYVTNRTQATIQAVKEGLV
ncbi:TPA: response regulator transcription factor [Candidatus Avigastranaerophilus faecigallinarum]|nr:response regulator transcription factor [Candidatus Avigastranaerophilus faecigallinarum]